MTKMNEERQKSWHERAIDEKAHRDAQADHYDPPPSWLPSRWLSRQSSDRHAYDAGWERAKAAAPWKLDLRGTFLRRTVFASANLERARLNRADFTNANFRGANFKDTDLEGTILHGADLTDAKNLTLEQLSKAIVDENTKLPEGITFEGLRTVVSSS
jgi:uncharacterized protein YjbI with pentapeptide repeats